MRLKNKKTGEIGYLCSTNWNEIALIIMDKNGVQLGKYGSLTELNEEWEDYEEPKEYYCIDWTENDGIGNIPYYDDICDDFNKQIGNYFETEEEAELAVRKLKAWKRLKDAGYRFREWYEKYKNGEPDYGVALIEMSKPDGYSCDLYETYNKELDLLFGGE